MRLLTEEPRHRPHESSTAVVCLSFDPEELLDTKIEVKVAVAAEPPPVGVGRGSGRDSAPGSPVNESGGRGRGRRDTIEATQSSGGGRGRGSRQNSFSSSSEMDQVALVKRRISVGNDKEAVLPQVNDSQQHG